MSKDKELIGNEIIEENIAGFLANQTEEQLAALLTSIRKQMQNEASFVVAIDANTAAGMKLKEVSLKDGRTCGLVFTSFEQQMLGTQVISTFMVNMRQLFEAVLTEDKIDGLLINAYDKAFLLDRTFVSLVLGR